MGFGLIITSGDDKTPLPDTITQWLVEARVEMELSKPTKYALRFEDDICEGQPAVANAPELGENRKIGIFVLHDDALECLVYGPVTEIKTSTMLGGAGSWVEVHGEDRRIEMARIDVQASYPEKASDAAAKILQAYEFEPSTQETLIQYDENKKLTQRSSDLAFLDDIARRNNMEFWIAYKAERKPLLPSIELTETANLRTSPPRAQPGDVPQIPILTAEESRVLKVNPPRNDCPTVNKFEAKIDFEKPTASTGFAITEQEGQAAVAQIVMDAEPVDPGKPVPIEGIRREIIAAPEPSEDQAFLAKETIVYEQSWFVEVDCSSTPEQLDFVVLPHQIVQVAHAGDRLEGAYQVTSAIHVVTATDHFMDFKLRANGLGGGG